MTQQSSQLVEIDRFKMALDSAKIGIWIWDVIHDKLTWDTRMYQLYGIRSEDFSGAYDAWQAGLHADDKARGDMEIQNALKGEKEFDITFRVMWPDATVHWISGHAKITRDATGKPLEMVGVNWDVTPAKEAEESLRKKIIEVEDLNNLMIGRELKMVELKKKISQLSKKLDTRS